MERNILVAFLDRNRIQLKASSATSIVAIEIPVTAVKDLELLDGTILEAQIRTGVVQNKITPGPVILLLSESVSFTKEVPKGQLQEPQPSEFLSLVPFESVQTKQYATDRGNILVGTNKELLETIIHTLNMLGLSVLTVVPLVLLGPTGAKRWLDLELANYVAAHVDFFKQQSMMNVSQIGGRPPEQTTIAGGSRNKLFLLVGVFVALILILVFLLVVRK